MLSVVFSAFLSLWFYSLLNNGYLPRLKKSVNGFQAAITGFSSFPFVTKICNVVTFIPFIILPSSLYIFSVYLMVYILFYITLVYFSCLAKKLVCGSFFPKLDMGGEWLGEIISDWLLIAILSTAVIHLTCNFANHLSLLGPLFYFATI